MFFSDMNHIISEETGQLRSDKTQEMLPRNSIFKRREKPYFEGENFYCCWCCYSSKSGKEKKNL